MAAMSELNFFVNGTPAPGGSKTFFPVWRKGPRGFELVTEMRGDRPWPIIRVTDAGGERNKEWKAAVTVQGRQFMQSAPPFDEPMKVEFIFFIRRPKAHYRTGKFAHMLRGEAPAHHTQAPDASKFARSTEDALTGVVWKDDSVNVRVCSEKRWMRHDDREGCAVRIILLRSPIPGA